MKMKIHNCGRVLWRHEVWYVVNATRKLQAACYVKMLVTRYQTARFINIAGHILKGMTNIGLQGKALFLNYETETRTTVGNKNDSMARMFSGYLVVRPISPGGKPKEFFF